jgi:predicted nucleic acid-binding protein
MRPPLILVDTGPLLAAANRNDEYHQRSRCDLEKLTQEKRSLVVTYPTLLEGHSLALRRLGKQASEEWLADVIVGALTVNPVPEDYRQAILRIARYRDQGITLFDAVAATVAERIGAEVWTYDHHFDVMGVRVWR